MIATVELLTTTAELDVETFDVSLTVSTLGSVEVNLGGVGPQGPKGDPAGASEATAGASVTAGSVVALLSDGLLYPANANDASHRGRVVGVAETSVSSGDVARYIPAGVVDAPCALPVGSRAWVGTTAGQLVSAPSLGAQWSQEVGTVNADGLLSVSLSVAIERG